MEKLLLDLEQTEALNKLVGNLKADPERENNGDVFSHFNGTYEYCEAAQAILEEIFDSIHNAMVEIEDHHYCEPMKRLVNTPELFRKLNRAIKDAEAELALAVEKYDNTVEKTNFKLLFSDEELIELIDDCNLDAGHLELEKRDSDIFIIFTKHGINEDEDEQQEIRIATGAKFEGELNIALKYINKLINS